MDGVSCFFRVDDQDVWNPSNSVARIFLSTARGISEEFTLPSGLGKIINDECEVNGDEFSAFATELLVRYERSNNKPLKELLEGVIAISLVMLDRAGRDVGTIVELDDAWLLKREGFARSMPRG
ncbi:DUF6086 family protein [Streptomyces sp. NPDC088757]|uniref:DUF6086 family protein n=1 Tax=Streptomyces sp. NPDC088757 TaxID=3365889 RepID=UPI0037FAB134